MDSLVWLKLRQGTVFCNLRMDIQFPVLEKRRTKWDFRLYSVTSL